MGDIISLSKKQIRLIIDKVSHLEEQLKLSQEQLAHSEAAHNETVTRLAGGIAHYFNNALAGIVGYADLLNSEFGAHNPKIHKDTETIIKISQKSAGLVDRLLTFSGQGMYNVTDLDMHKKIKDVHKEVDSFIEGKPILITEELHASYPIVHGAKNQLYTALLTLCINACEAVGEKGHVCFATENVSLDSHSRIDHYRFVIPGDYIKISVIDDGKGLDEKIKKTIFEPFLNLRNSTTGTGLGLASVFGAVKNHDGYIDVISSSHHKGTRFELYLPVAKKAGDK